MTTKRFSNQQLHALRNEIPIAELIENTLGIACRRADGCFRFLCPMCNEFDTAVNPKTNLARCFGCGKNFNTIDLVMLIQNRDFVDSVRFLKGCRQNRPTLLSPQRKTDTTPSAGHIGEILTSIVPSISEKSLESGKSLLERIVALEEKIEYLALQIKEVRKSLE